MANALATLPKSSSGDNANAKKNIMLPPKPYTEYTIFFRLERTYLLQSTGIVAEEIASSLDPSHFDPVEHPRPARYERLALPPYWYSSSHKADIEKRRKHRKRAGRMDLKTLSKTISARWKKANEDVVNYCKKLAKAEKNKYEESINGMISMESKNQDDKVTDADADAKDKASSGVQLQQWQQVLLLPTKKPSEVVSASPFVLAQAKQQAGNSAMTQRPSNKMAPKSAAAVSLQDFVFSKPNQEEKVAPEVISNGALSLQGLVSSKPKQATNTTMPKSMPAAAAPITVSDNINRLRESFNEVMGYTSSGAQINQERESVLQVLRLQALQYQKMNILGAVSPSSVKSPTPFANARDLRVDHSTAPATAPLPFANGTVPNNVNGVVRLAKKHKRRLVRRVSGPPEFLAHGTLPYAFVGEENPRGTKRRSSMIDLGGLGPGPRLDTARGPSNSLEEEPDHERFSHVPNWEKEDADELLDCLDVPRAGEPAVGSNRALELAADRETGLFMNDIGMGDDSYCY